MLLLALYFIKDTSTAKHIIHNNYNLKSEFNLISSLNSNDKIVLFFHIIILPLVNQFPLTL